ncbi:MAG: hypothetical protein FWC47_07615 [Oscillospiraceae bacterium]|nr:hypothetical protein [Oscillospiraceae bacterium]
MRKILIFIMVIALGLSSTTVFAASVKGTNAGIHSAKISAKPYSLLGGRLSISMPEGSKIITTSSSNILGPLLSNELETRVSFKTGSEELILCARELFCFSKNDLVKDVNYLLDNNASDPLFSVTNCIADGLPMVVVVPLQTITTEDGTFVYGAVVKNQDGNLISVYIYANSNAYKQKSDCNSISEQIIKSIKRGTRTLAVNKRNVTIDNNIILTVQSGCAAFVDIEKDYKIYNFVKVVPVGGYWSNMGIFSGKNPDYAGPSEGATTKDDIILGQKIKWQYTFSDVEDPNSQVFLDTLLTVQNKNPKTGKTTTNKYHIFIDANSSKDLDSLQNMARSMKFMTAK